LIAILLAHTAAIASAQTVLIDFDDGIPGNGIHEASIRNGGFEEGATGQTFRANTRLVKLLQPGRRPVDADAGTPTPKPAVCAGLASGWSGTGTRQQPSITIPASDWTIAAGDVFSVSVDWRNGSGFSGQLGSDPACRRCRRQPGDGSGEWRIAGDRLLSRTNALAPATNTKPSPSPQTRCRPAARGSGSGSNSECSTPARGPVLR
jgi:hypothetical protein